MKILSLLLSIFLIGCSPAYNSYVNIDRAFQVICKADTIVSSINTDGEVVVFKATCTKEK